MCYSYPPPAQWVTPLQTEGYFGSFIGNIRRLSRSGSRIQCWSRLVIRTANFLFALRRHLSLQLLSVKLLSVPASVSCRRSPPSWRALLQVSFFFTPPTGTLIYILSDIVGCLVFCHRNGLCPRVHVNFSLCDETSCSLIKDIDCMPGSCNARFLFTTQAVRIKRLFNT